MFLKTEHRGTDATGFYALEPGDGVCVLDKEPVKACDYIKREIWTRDFFNHKDVDLFIGHCRQTSVGGGPEKVNKNNHPHWSDDRRVAMTHNGKIPEFTALKNRYDVESECDSEILLRMFESAQMIAKDREEELKKEFPTLTPFLAERLLGLKEIFSRVNYGAMAVAIAERGDDGQRYLWLFRDEERPLWVVDMRETLGQVFYCSTAEIWRNAVDATPSLKEKFVGADGQEHTYLPNDQVMIEFPAYQIWLLNLDPSKALANPAGELEQGEECWNVRKFKITKTKYIDWQEKEDEDDKLSFKKPDKEKAKPPVMKVVSRLGNNDVIKEEKKPAQKDLFDETPETGEVSGPPVPAKDQGGKKKINSGVGGDTGRVKSSVSAQVIVNAELVDDKTATVNDDSRSPGDESEYDAVLKNATAVLPFDEGVIDLDAFDKTIEQVEEKLAQIKTLVHTQATGRNLDNRSFSQVLDSLESIRQNAMRALNVLDSK